MKTLVLRNGLNRHKHCLVVLPGSGIGQRNRLKIEGNNLGHGPMQSGGSGRGEAVSEAKIHAATSQISCSDKPVFFAPRRQISVSLHSCQIGTDNLKFALAQKMGIISHWGRGQPVAPRFLIALVIFRGQLFFETC